MKNQNDIVCIKKTKTDKEGYLFFRSKGRENRAKKSLGIKVNFLGFKDNWDKKKQRFKSGMWNRCLLAMS